MLALALGLRLAALWAASGARMVLDEKGYWIRAEALLDGRGFVGSYQSWVRHKGAMLEDLPQYPGSYQPPLYTFFMAAVMSATGKSLLAVKLAQVLLGALTTAAIYALGRSWYDHRRALTAAAIYALDPTLIAFTHYLWSETLYALLLVTAVLVLTVEPAPARRRRLFVAGVLFGLAALTRSVIVTFLPLLVAWMLLAGRRSPRPALGGAFALALGASLVIAPWTLRNTLLHGGLVPIDSNGPLNLWRGNSPGALPERPPRPQDAYLPPFERIPLMPVQSQSPAAFVAAVKRALGEPRPTDLEIMRCGTRLAWDHIRGDPALFVRRGWLKAADLWNPTSFLLRHFRFQAYGPVDPRAEAFVSWWAVAAYLAVAILALTGLLLSIRDRHTWLVILLVLHLTAIHAVTFGLTRFRLPLMPFLILLAANGLGRLGRWWPRQRWRSG